MVGGGPCFEHLLVVDDPEPRSGPVNMAFDELLLNESRGLPTLRFYRWKEPAVSFGYFETAESARRLAGGREIVRRMTGGGLVEHGDDLTYTLVVPRPDAFVRLPSVESYRRIHAAVALALARGGLLAQSHAVAARAPAEGNACFERPVLHDLIDEGRKIAGGAQRRTRAGLLHQGSIRLGAEESPAHVGWMQAARDALSTVLGRRCEIRPVSAGEIARAGELAGTRYATAVWTDRV